MVSRRDAVSFSLGALVAASLPVGLYRSFSESHGRLDWGRGYDGQRIADLGNGLFRNPIFAGDHPDPSILKVGDTYYLTFSTFDAYPGLMIWQSQDLINWQPVTAALTKPIGSVWAPDLAYHNGRFYLYIPARFEEYKSIYVIYADKIEGPWSDPIDLKLPDHIDPAHIVDENGQRFLFLSQGDIVQLAENGLSTEGDVAHVYDPWRYPEDWDVECFCPEGPKLVKKDGWFYMLTAVGGTAGPPTGHMVIAARSKSLMGPWEHAPHNPIARTQTRAEAWWSRGHASLIEGPAGEWWMISHGYEKDFWTLGRQCILEPIRWRPDGWFEAIASDLSEAMEKPRLAKAHPTDTRPEIIHGQPLSDSLRGSLGQQWAFYRPGRSEEARLTTSPEGLYLAAKGDGPANSSPLAVVAGDQAYECEVTIDRNAGAQAGLLLFYNWRLYCGLGFDDFGLVMHRFGTPRRIRDIVSANTSRLSVRIKNDHHIVTCYLKQDHGDWKKFDVQMEVSGYHHNTAYDFLSLRPALFVSGSGEARFSDFKYRAV